MTRPVWGALSSVYVGREPSPANAASSSSSVASAHARSTACRAAVADPARMPCTEVVLMCRVLVKPIDPFVTGVSDTSHSTRHPGTRAPQARGIGDLYERRRVDLIKLPDRCAARLWLASLRSG